MNEIAIEDTDKAIIFPRMDNPLQTDKVSLCIFKDFQTKKYGINITAPKLVLGFLMENDPSMGLGGELTTDKIKALRDFLTDVLEGKA